MSLRNMQISFTTSPSNRMQIKYSWKTVEEEGKAVVFHLNSGGGGGGYASLTPNFPPLNGNQRTGTGKSTRLPFNVIMKEILPKARSMGEAFCGRFQLPCRSIRFDFDDEEGRQPGNVINLKCCTCSSLRGLRLISRHCKM